MQDTMGFERSFEVGPEGRLCEDALAFYETYGFLVLRDLIDQELCEQAKAEFLRRVKPYDGLIMRQTTTREEKHNISEQGLMTNPILDFHKLDIEPLRHFRRTGLDVVTHPKLRDCLTQVMTLEPALVQTMYFESSRGTDPHMDAHFVDSTREGGLIGCWIALESIHAEGGRFTFYPGSHRVEDPAYFDPETVAFAKQFADQSVKVIQGYQFDHRAASLMDITKQRRYLRKLIKASGLVAYTPEMGAGDAVFFGSKVIHASLKPGLSGHTRHSITAHFVPSDGGIMRSSKQEVPLTLERHQRLLVHCGD